MRIEVVEEHPPLRKPVVYEYGIFSDPNHRRQDVSVPRYDIAGRVQYHQDVFYGFYLAYLAPISFLVRNFTFRVNTVFPFLVLYPLLTTREFAPRDASWPSIMFFTPPVMETREITTVTPMIIPTDGEEGSCLVAFYGPVGDAD